MLTDNESPAAAERSEANTQGDPHPMIDVDHGSAELDQLHHHGAAFDGYVSSEEAEASGCPYAAFFSQIFGDAKS